jgi:hypothetical protein
VNPFGVFFALIGVAWLVAVAFCIADSKARLAVRAFLFGFRGRYDPSAALFRTIIELLKTRPREWRMDRHRLWLPSTDVGIWIANDDYGLVATAIHGENVLPSNGIKPGPYWRHQLWRAVQERRRNAEKVAALTALCDELEAAEPIAKLVWTRPTRDVAGR